MAPSWLRVDGRHGAWVHPLGTMLFLFCTIIGCTILAHDWIVSASPDYGTQHGDMFEKAAPPTNFHSALAAFFFVYIVVMIGSRYLDCGSYIFYESVWCCNSSLIMAGIGILTNRPLLIGASVAGVCCDQSIWYIDCACYLLTGKFKIGVAKYLLWPETTWSKRYLCTHHLYVHAAQAAVVMQQRSRSSLWLCALILLCVAWCVSPSCAVGSFRLRCGVLAGTSLATASCWRASSPACRPACLATPRRSRGRMSTMATSTT